MKLYLLAARNIYQKPLTGIFIVYVSGDPQQYAGTGLSERVAHSGKNYGPFWPAPAT